MAVLAEKPSVARDIAKVLRATTRGEGDLHGNGYVVTWAIGHLASLAKPHEIHPQWKIWRRETLPMLPEVWPLVVYEKTKDQFEVVRKILSSSRVGRVICATDAGREGELISATSTKRLGVRSPLAGCGSPLLRRRLSGRVSALLSRARITSRWPMRHGAAAGPTGWSRACEAVC